MKVFFDVSVAGVGFTNANGHSRAGIFRAVDSLLAELVEVQALDITLSSIISNDFSADVTAYLDHDSRLSTVKRCVFDFGTVQRYLGQRQTRIGDRLTASPSPNSVHRIVLRANRKAAFLTEKLIRKFSYSRAIQALEGQVDIYHSSFFELPKELLALDIKRFLTVYDLIPITMPQFFVSQNMPPVESAINSLKADDWAITISQSTKDDLCNFRPDLDPEHIFVTHLAASNLFYPVLDRSVLEVVRKKYGIPDAPYLLSLSTLEPRKNIIQTIRSFAQLITTNTISDLHLVLVGARGWKADAIFSEVNRYQEIKDRIVVSGYVDDQDLAAIYSGALAFVYPSYYEGFGLPPLEAMQCGTPVITSNTSSLPEVVGDAGIMVDPHASDDLSQAMLTLYSSDALRQEYADRALARSRQFSWEKCAADTYNAYLVAMES